MHFTYINTVFIYLPFKPCALYLFLYQPPRSEEIKRKAFDIKIWSILYSKFSPFVLNVILAYKQPLNSTHEWNTVRANLDMEVLSFDVKLICSAEGDRILHLINFLLARWS